MARAGRKNIIANPNCSTAQMVVALKPLHDAREDQARRRGHLPVRVGRRQGSHGRAVEPDQGHLRDRSPTPQKFTKQIAFNVIPHIDVFMDSGDTKEEWKMVAETKKILDPKIKLTATCVRVPVFVGHSEAVNIEFERSMSRRGSPEPAREAPGLMVVDKREDGGYVTPVECVGDYATFVSASARIPPSRTASTCGACRTTCAKARRSTPFRLPRRWSTVV
jgi:aspartate-semialdehyde dehydrogenase